VDLGEKVQVFEHTKIKTLQQPNGFVNPFWTEASGCGSYGCLGVRRVLTEETSRTPLPPDECEGGGDD
jgi:hypothetical protein